MRCVWLPPTSMRLTVYNTRRRAIPHPLPWSPEPTAWIRSAMVTCVPSLLAAGHSDNGALPTAMFTPSTISLTITRPSPLQSPISRRRRIVIAGSAYPLSGSPSVRVLRVDIPALSAVRSLKSTPRLLRGSPVSLFQAELWFMRQSPVVAIPLGST